MPYSAQNLVWIDLEMTGLDPQQDRIIEIATLVTDKDLNLLAEGPVLAVHQSEEVLKMMDAWNWRTHGGSGLVERVRTSALLEADVQRATLDFLHAWLPARASPICGNSICQDRRFLARWMPALEAFFHYRNLDVSTVKELASRWAPQVVKKLKKEGAHQALDDIRESVAELRYYREAVFKI
jgi:oligoribonuclease